MNPNLPSVDQLVETIFSVAGESASYSDSVSWGRIQRSSGEGSSKRYSITLISDPNQVVDGLINQTGFDLQPGDMVLVYKIQNQWSNALIIAKKNISFETAPVSSNTNPQSDQNDILEPNSSEATLYYYGPEDGFDSFYSAPFIQAGALCDTEVELTEFSNQKVEAQWNCGQPFDCWLPYSLRYSWLGNSGALVLLGVAHDTFPDEVTQAIDNSIYALYSGTRSGIFNFAEDRVGPGDTLLIARKSPQDTVLDDDIDFRVLGVLSKYNNSLQQN